MVVFLLTIIVLLLVALVAPGLIGTVMVLPGVYVLYLIFSATTIGSILGVALVAFIGLVVYLCATGKMAWE